MRLGKAVRPTLFGLAAVAVLALTTAPAAQAAFPGKNGRIVFSTFTRHSQIYSVRPDGSGLRQLTHVAKGHFAADPNVSPDGTRIAFTKDDQVWVMNADGSAKQQLTSDTDFNNRQPSWSPDGDSIAFSRCDVSLGFELNCAIDVMDSGGAGITEVIGDNWVSQRPEFSPDGQRIAFASTRGGYVSAVWTVGVDGSDPTRLTRPILEANNPEWAPDGSKIMFGDHVDIPRSNIWVMDADGSHQRQLTHVPPDGDAPLARFSPNGRRIALLFQEPPARHWHLFEMRPNGRHLHRVPGVAHSVGALDWGTAP
jgi:Tol biopolymer transport system component